ncbi:MAG: DUF4421 family protein [bacterium]
MAIARKSLLIGMVLILGGGMKRASAIPQHEKEYFELEIDTAYITDYKKLLTTRYYLLAQNTRFTLFPEHHATLEYKPNEAGRIGLAAFYSWFGLGLSIGNNLFRKDPDIYGTTSSIDFRVNAYGKFIALETYIQYYQGFYLEYKSDILKEAFPVPDMKLLSFGLEFTYVYNFSKFSIRASFIQNERQKKSAGSLIVKPSFRYYYVEGDTGIVPGEILDIYHIHNTNLHSGHFFSLGLAPGYIYTFVFLKNFYLTLGGLVEVCWGNYDYETTNFTENSTGYSFPASFRAALGYNSDTWFIGASYISTPFYIKPGERVQNDFHYKLNQYRFWVGTRFDAFKKRNKKK